MPQSPALQVLRLGTRASKLARVQAEIVRGKLAARGHAVELVLIKTSGDRIQDRPLAEFGGKGLFTKELEHALLAGEIDLAVHSLKDVPALLPDGLAIAAVLEREDVRDAFVSRQSASLEELPAGARVGTSSVRRIAQVLRARPDLDVVPLRGNVDTRLARLDSGECDATLLAYAGLKRLDLEERATSILSAERWLPALCQGAIGIEIRSDATDVSVAVGLLNHAPTSVAVACERAFQKALDGSCKTAMGGLAQLSGNTLSFRGEVLSSDGRGFAETALMRDVRHDPLREAERAGRDAACDLKARARAWLPA